MTDRRVNITYAVDLDEVPDRVVSLMREAIEQLEGLCNSLHQITNELDNSQNVVKTCQSMDETRKHLMKLDIRLEDCQALLAGYQRACADMSQPPAPSTDLEDEEQQLFETVEENDDE